MIKYFVRLEQASDQYWSVDEWKDFVCEDFDENVVLLGNHDYNAHEEASWWADAKNISDVLSWYTADAVDQFISELEDSYGKDKLYEIFDFYHNNNYEADDVEMMIKIVETIYPGFKLSHGIIRGNNQGDWQAYVCLDGEVDVDLLEDWYFGNVYDATLYEVNTDELEEDEDPETIDYLIYGDDMCCEQITDSEYWKMYRAGLVESFIKLFGLPEDADLTVDEDQ